MRSGFLPLLVLAAFVPAMASDTFAEQTLSEAANPPKTIASAAVAVAPFEQIAPRGSSLPDVAMLIADRLATRGVGRVLGPGAWEAPARWAPASHEVRMLAEKAEVGAVVVGRTTQVGRRLSVDVRLRSGTSGDVAGTYVAEAARPEDVAGAVDRLTADLLAGLPAALGTSFRVAEVAAVSRGPRAPAGPEAPTEASAGRSILKAPLGERGPISIRSDELEALDRAGRRTLLFTRNVRVTQGELRLNSDRLEALYPAGSSQPERLVARGHVKIHRGGRNASCDEATYQRTEQRVICRGNARMEQDCGWVSGKEIELDLATERLFVRGDTQVHICRDEARRVTEGGE